MAWQNTFLLSAAPVPYGLVADTVAVAQLFVVQLPVYDMPDPEPPCDDDQFGVVTPCELK